jgi:hypothetical protein
MHCLDALACYIRLRQVVWLHVGLLQVSGAVTTREPLPVLSAASIAATWTMARVEASVSAAWMACAAASMVRLLVRLSESTRPWKHVRLRGFKLRSCIGHSRLCCKPSARVSECV